MDVQQLEARDKVFVELFEAMSRWQALRSAAHEHMKRGLRGFVATRCELASSDVLTASAYEGREHMQAVVTVKEPTCEVDRDDVGLTPSATKGVRRRLWRTRDDDYRPPDSDEEEEEEEEEDGGGGKEETSMDLSRHPLLWFGAFLPSEAREAQEEYSAALLQLVEMAQLQRKVAELAERLEGDGEVVE